MPKTVLITGAARRIGAACARVLHAEGYRVIIHYQHSVLEAQALVSDLNALRADSAFGFAADLSQMDSLRQLAENVLSLTDSLDALINNAAQFFPLAVEQTDETAWYQVFDSNLKAPFFLTQSVLPALRKAQGCVVNVADIYGQRPLAGYAAYSMSKAALLAMTQALAVELAPTVRVNAVAPGAILWPESGHDAQAQLQLLNKVALRRCGNPDDIAKAVRYLVMDAGYVTGQILNIDGGRLLFI